LLSEHGISVWLDCPFEVVRRRVRQPMNRPLARDAQKFAALYESRREAYALADLRVKIESDDPACALETILSHSLFR